MEVDLGDLPLSLRDEFKAGVLWRVSAGWNVHAAEAAAELVVRRKRAWELRSVDAKPCSTCKGLVLWRVEGKANVPVDSNGYRHVCNVRW